MEVREFDSLKIYYNQCNCFAFDYHNQEVGFFILRDLGAEIIIELLEIYREKRNYGFGNHMVKYIIDFCSKFKPLKLTLFVDFDNEIAQHVYKKWGFKFTGDINQYCYKMEYNYDKQ
jgi:RimJ/RimL family protein N-acetyltransferase